MDQLTLGEKVGVNYMLLTLAGAVNSYTIAELNEKIDAYLPDSYVVVDMEQVLALDSAGIGVLLSAHNDAEEYGTKLFLMNPSDAAKHSLEKTGFFDLLNIIHSVTEVSDDI